MKEGDFSRELIKSLQHQYPACYARKTVQNAYTGGGEPDVKACIGGRYIGIECKLIKDRSTIPEPETMWNMATALQRQELADIEIAGGRGWLFVNLREPMLCLCMQVSRPDAVKTIRKLSGIWQVAPLFLNV